MGDVRDGILGEGVSELMHDGVDFGPFVAGGGAAGDDDGHAEVEFCGGVPFLGDGHGGEMRDVRVVNEVGEGLFVMLVEMGEVVWVREVRWKW